MIIHKNYSFPRLKLLVEKLEQKPTNQIFFKVPKDWLFIKLWVPEQFTVQPPLPPCINNLKTLLIQSI